MSSINFFMTVKPELVIERSEITHQLTTRMANANQSKRCLNRLVVGNLYAIGLVSWSLFETLKGIPVMALTTTGHLLDLRPKLAGRLFVVSLKSTVLHLALAVAVLFAMVVSICSLGRCQIFNESPAPLPLTFKEQLLEKAENIIDTFVNSVETNTGNESNPDIVALNHALATTELARARLEKELNEAKQTILQLTPKAAAKSADSSQ